MHLIIDLISLAAGLVHGVLETAMEFAVIAACLKYLRTTETPR